MKKLTIAAGAAVLAMSATALLAAPGDMAGTMTGKMGHAKIDADGNGSVTRAEAQGAANAAWIRLDANKDGKLDPADRTARRAARFDRIDADRNGAISRAEFDARPVHNGKMRDHAGMAGHDGMAAHENGMRGHRMGGGKRHGRGGGGMMAMAKMADTNADGAVSRTEFDAGITRHFAMVDADNDGSISKAERQAAHDKMRAAWKAKRPAATTN